MNSHNSTCDNRWIHMNKCIHFLVFFYAIAIGISSVAATEGDDNVAVSDSLLIKNDKQPVEQRTPIPKILNREQLAISTPDDWQVAYRFANDNMRLIQFIPNHEKVGSWLNKITVEHITDTSQLPTDILAGFSAQARSDCKDLDLSKLYLVEENNYKTVVRWQFCGQHKEHSLGEITLYKAIQGEEYTYVISRSKRLAAFSSGSDLNELLTEDELANWSSYMKRIKVCHPGKVGYECPSWYRAFFESSG